MFSDRSPLAAALSLVDCTRFCGQSVDPPCCGSPLTVVSDLLPDSRTVALNQSCIWGVSWFSLSLMDTRVHVTFHHMNLSVVVQLFVALGYNGNCG